jgi:hypothetical protein
MHFCAAACAAVAEARNASAAPVTFPAIPQRLHIDLEPRVMRMPDRGVAC